MKQKHRYRVGAIVATLAAVVTTFVVTPHYSHTYGDSYGYMPPPPPPTPPLNWWLIGGIGGGVVAIALLLTYLLWWRGRAIT